MATSITSEVVGKVAIPAGASPDGAQAVGRRYAAHVSRPFQDTAPEIQVRPTAAALSVEGRAAPGPAACAASAPRLLQAGGGMSAAGPARAAAARHRESRHRAPGLLQDCPRSGPYLESLDRHALGGSPSTGAPGRGMQLSARLAPPLKRNGRSPLLPPPLGAGTHRPGAVRPCAVQHRRRAQDPLTLRVQWWAAACKRDSLALRSTACAPENRGGPCPRPRAHVARAHTYTHATQSYPRAQRPGTRPSSS